MAEYQCDTECGELAVMSVTNFATSETAFFCGRCYGITGAILLRDGDPEVWAELTAPPVPEPEPKKGQSRKPKAEPEYPLNEPLAVIIEDQPRPPDAAEGGEVPLTVD